MIPEEKINELKDKLYRTLELLKIIVHFTTHSNSDDDFLTKEINNIIKMQQE